MMAALRRWLLGIVLTSLAGGLAQRMAPRGREQAMVRLVGGLLLVLALLGPLGSLDGGEPAIEAGSFRARTEAQAEQYRENQLETLSAIIAEKTETYIWDKARSLGAERQVTVTVSTGAGGIPLPETVTLTGGYDSVLAAWIDEEVGIPVQGQIWLEGSAWSETKEEG